MKALGWVPIVFLSIFYAFSFFALGMTLLNAWRSTVPRAWPTTPGTITKLALTPGSSGSDEGTTYQVELRYTYTVNGKIYEGTCLAFGYAATSGYSVNHEIYQKLKESKTIAVRYDAANPRSSCLSYGVHRSIKIGFAFALTFLTFTIGITCLMWFFASHDRVLLRNLANPQAAARNAGASDHAAHPSLYDAQLDAQP